MLVSKESYEQMYKADPNSWRIHQVLAQSFVEADRLDEAVNECRQAIQLKQGEPGLHEELADIYMKQNQLSQAEAEFQNELKVDPESVTAMYKLAVVSLERSKPEVAAGLLSEVLRRTPNSSDAHYQMGRAEAQLGNIDLAIASFAAAVRESPTGDTETLRQSYYQLAQLYRRQQEPDKSRAALDSFMRLKEQADAQQERKLQDKLKRSAQMQEATP
jgi:tetratricopeptide (TPR) repeat protein